MPYHVTHASRNLTLTGMKFRFRYGFIRRIKFVYNHEFCIFKRHRGI